MHSPSDGVPEPIADVFTQADTECDDASHWFAAVVAPVTPPPAQNAMVVNVEACEAPRSPGEPLGPMGGGRGSRKKPRNMARGQEKAAAVGH